MDEGKAAYILLAFLLVGGLKKALPEQRELLRGEIASVMDSRGDCVKAVKAMGRLFIEDGAENTVFALNNKPAGEIGQAEDKELCASEGRENEAVEVFLQSQALITDKEMPEKVMLEIPELPFEYICPAEAAESSGFGYRLHPIYNELRFHYGTDYALNTGQEVRAFASGRVFAAGRDEGYGNYLIISHGGGYSSLYAHLSEYKVSEGDCVEMGQTVALSGSSGRATGPHLHFELMLEGKYLNPEFYV